jgi:hypothetical protein
MLRSIPKPDFQHVKTSENAPIPQVQKLSSQVEIKTQDFLQLSPQQKAAVDLLKSKISKKGQAKSNLMQVDGIFEERFLNEIENDGFDLVEEFIIQHPDINRLSPSAVNTVRIFTQLTNDNQVEILGCRLRISVNSSIDNLAAGNIAVELDELSGKATRAAVYSDITKEPVEFHPITKVKIVGFQVPMWRETVEMVKKAALFNTSNRSIGWDIVITENGPGLIEGNHDWCKLLWQLPVNQGLKSLLS